MKNFCSYNQGRMLKELGIDEWMKEDKEVYYGVFIDEKPIQIIDDGKTYHNAWQMAYLNSQAFRFLREKYGFMHRINNDLYDEEIIFRFDVIKIKGGFNEFSCNPHKSYDQAEISCLDDMIETVKNMIKIEKKNGK